MILHASVYNNYLPFLFIVDIPIDAELKMEG